MANWVAAGVVALGGLGLLGGWGRGGHSAIKMALLSATVRFSKFHPKFWPVWLGALSQIGRYVTQVVSYTGQWVHPVLLEINNILCLVLRMQFIK